ncbi:MAG: tRNA threonylcarbamoyladenosine dehydratase [Comamonadaceae bacterium]|nr:tRNA threonylcarbamoyladenosine dehydratase [Comamonadaceae bacterium]
MDDDLQRRFGGLARLYGPAGAARMRAAHVAVVGIGGVGSWAAEALARSGVGQITLIDLDNVAESNVNRQIHALSGTLGQPKVDAMAARISLIHPGCTVHRVEDFASPANWPALLPAPVDALIDACDQAAAKLALAAWALQTRTPFVTCGAAGGKRHGERVEIADLADVTHDPLLATLRARLRQAGHIPKGQPARAGQASGARQQGRAGGGKSGITAVFSRESVAPPDAACAVQGDGSLNCHGFGSAVTVTATFGFCAAGWLLNKISCHP